MSIPVAPACNRVTGAALSAQGRSTTSLTHSSSPVGSQWHIVVALAGVLTVIMCAPLQASDEGVGFKRLRQSTPHSSSSTARQCLAAEDHNARAEEADQCPSRDITALRPSEQQGNPRRDREQAQQGQDQQGPAHAARVHDLEDATYRPGGGERGVDEADQRRARSECEGALHEQVCPSLLTDLK